MDQARLGASPTGQLVPIIGPDPVTHEFVEGRPSFRHPCGRFDAVSTKTWTAVNRHAWISFFAEGVAASAVASQLKVEGLVELQNDLRARVQAAGKRRVAERLAADLVGRPYLARRDVAGRYTLSGPGAFNAIATLVELGILREAAINPRGARVAPEVVDLVST